MGILLHPVPHRRVGGEIVEVETLVGMGVEKHIFKRPVNVNFVKIVFILYIKRKISYQSFNRVPQSRPLKESCKNIGI
jgi:hypothetical protein